MIATLREIFERLRKSPGERDEGEREGAIRLATASLLVEMARADHAEKMVESAMVVGLLREHFALPTEEASELVALAERELHDTVSLQRFTRALHEALSESEKLNVVEMLWRVAWADANLHPHEDHLMRKLCNLLYVRDADRVRLRNSVMEETRG